MGYTALQSGLAMIPRGLGALIAMPLAGRLVGKIQGRYLVAGGFLSFGLGTYALAQLSLDLTPWILFWPLFFSGVSIAFMFVPLNTLALGALKPEQIGNASGIFNLMRNVGGSVGISHGHHARRAHGAGASNHAGRGPDALRRRLSIQPPFHDRRRWPRAATPWSPPINRPSVRCITRCSTQANLLAYLDNFRWFTLLCFACLVGALLLKNVKVHGPVAAH